MSAQVVPVPTEGHGHYTWTGSNAVANTYHIRRGRDVVARVALYDNLPFHSSILNDLCRVLDNTERDTTDDCVLIPITQLGEPDTVVCNVIGHNHDDGGTAA